MGTLLVPLSRSQKVRQRPLKPLLLVALGCPSVRPSFRPSVHPCSLPETPNRHPLAHPEAAPFLPLLDQADKLTVRQQGDIGRLLCASALPETTRWLLDVWRWLAEHLP